MHYANKVVAVTGGGSGIGRATALRFAEAGARVALCDLDRADLDDTLRQSDQADLLALEADVSDPAAMQQFYEAIDKRWGRLDAVFAHAGINGVWAPIEEMEPDEWGRTLQTNLTGTFVTVKYAVPLLKRQGGAIIITSSVNGTTKFSGKGVSAYASSKAGQIAFMKVMALELAQYDIRVNAICPGAIDTDIEASTEKRSLDRIEPVAEYPNGGIPITGGFPSQPDEVANLVLFLASEQAAFITGTPVWIDGGEALLQG